LSCSLSRRVISADRLEGAGGWATAGGLSSSELLTDGRELGRTRFFDIVHLLVLQKTIELTQIRRLDRDRGGCRKLCTLLCGGDHRLGREWLVSGQQPTQRVIDRRLAVAGRVLQDPQVLARAHVRRVFVSQPIVRQAKAAVREQVLAIPIVLKGAWLTHQLIDEMPIVDRVLVASHQTRQRVHATPAVPDFDAVRVESSLQLLADQAAMNRVRVAMNVNQAP
jgi:hypothetical protein